MSATNKSRTFLWAPCKCSLALSIYLSMDVCMHRSRYVCTPRVTLQSHARYLEEILVHLELVAFSLSMLCAGAWVTPREVPTSPHTALACNAKPSCAHERNPAGRMTQGR